MYDFVKNNVPHSFYDVRNTRDVQNIHRTSQSDMIHVYRCHTKCSSRLPLYTLPIIWNKWAISALGDFSRRRLPKSTTREINDLPLFGRKVRCKNNYCTEIVDNFFHLICSCLYLSLCPIFRCFIGCILHKSYCSRHELNNTNFFFVLCASLSRHAKQNPS